MIIPLPIRFACKLRELLNLGWDDGDPDVPIVLESLTHEIERQAALMKLDPSTGYPAMEKPRRGRR